jgi:hypothetical protein
MHGASAVKQSEPIFSVDKDNIGCIVITRPDGKSIILTSGSAERNAQDRIKNQAERSRTIRRG